MGQYNSDYDEVGVLAYLGKDIELNNGDIRITENNDLKPIKWKDNIKQAIINRLKTPKGFYDSYPEYGSNLYQAKGNPKNELTYNFIKGAIYEALLAEPRIEKINSINVSYNEIEKVLEISIKVTLIDDIGYLNLVFDYFI